MIIKFITFLLCLSHPIAIYLVCHRILAKRKISFGTGHLILILVERLHRLIILYGSDPIGWRHGHNLVGGQILGLLQVGTIHIVYRSIHLLGARLVLEILLLLCGILLEFLQVLKYHVLKVLVEVRVLQILLVRGLGGIIFLLVNVHWLVNWRHDGVWRNLVAVLSDGLVCIQAFLNIFLGLSVERVQKSDEI